MSVEKQFLDEIAKPGDQIDIEYCALLFSSRVQDSTKALEASREIDGQVNDFLENPPNFDETASFNTNYLIGVVDQVLGYRGDSIEYYSPDNSLLDKVIANRLGIPISLAAIYLAVGKRLGMTVHGIGFPGHFLIRVTEPDKSTTIVDPFAHKRLSKKEVEKLVAITKHQFGHFDEGWLKNTHPHNFLVRMLENLKSVYAHLNDVKRARLCLEFQLLLKPDEAGFLQQLQAFRDIDDTPGSNGSKLI